MKLTNGDIFQAQEPLKKLVGERLPVKVSYALAKLVMKLDEQFKVIEEVRNGLIKKYGEPDKENSQNISVKQDGENFPKFVADFNELMAVEVEIEKLEKVKLPEKGTIVCDNCKKILEKPFEIEATILISLDKFVEVV